MKDKNNPDERLRLQVFLSRSGYCSRRKAMDLIFRGRVSVNGKIVREPSLLVAGGQDRVVADGKEIGISRKQYILLNKPKGHVTTKADPFAAKTVMDLLPENLRGLNPVGRLDKDTEGLLLLTNDGELAHQLTHPKHTVDKTYHVKVKGALSIVHRKKLEQGITLEGRKTAPARIGRIRQGDNETELALTIHEGRKRQIRRMMEHLGCPVVSLKRLSLGPLSLGNLKPGCFRPLTPKEIDALRKTARPVTRRGIK